MRAYLLGGLVDGVSLDSGVARVAPIPRLPEASLEIRLDLRKHVVYLALVHLQYFQLSLQRILRCEHDPKIGFQLKEEAAVFDQLAIPRLHRPGVLAERARLGLKLLVPFVYNLFHRAVPN